MRELLQGFHVECDSDDSGADEPHIKSPFAVLLNLEQDTRGWTTTIRPNFVPKLSRLLKGMCRFIPTRERTVS